VLTETSALASLAERLRESNARFEALRGVLPAALAAQLRPGPIDEQGWTLMASNQAVAAKMRHWLPRLDEVLLAKGWKATPIRVHVQAPA
jgi:hypothetical protein